MEPRPYRLRVGVVLLGGSMYYESRYAEYGRFRGQNFVELRDTLEGLPWVLKVDMHREGPRHSAYAGMDHLAIGVRRSLRGLMRSKDVLLDDVARQVRMYCDTRGIRKVVVRVTLADMVATVIR